MKQQVSAIVLGAGRNSEGGELPPGLLSLDGSYSVLHWIKDALKDLINKPIYFVGGYRIKDIAAQHSDFSYILNPNWEQSGVLESLFHARVCMTERFLVSYSDIIYRKSLISALLNNHNDDIIIATCSLASINDNSGTKNRVCIASDGRVNNIGFLASSREVNAQFTGVVLFQNEGAKLAKKFLEEQYKKQRNQSFEQANKLKDGYLTDFIRFAIASGLNVRAVDATGDWSEINEVYSLAKFVLGTKGETLDRIAPLLKQSHVPPLLYFSLSEWFEKKPLVLSRIQEKFSERQLVIRSSSHHEDSWQQSNAGAFCSILDVSASDSPGLCRAIESVIASYPADNSPSANAHFLVQEMVQSVAFSGVVFTNTLETGAPYYLVNYQTGSNTDGITSGNATQQYLTHIRKSICTSNLYQPLAAVIDSVQEIENRLNHSALDIEFAVDESGCVHVLQVRPLTTSQVTEQKYKHHERMCDSIKNALSHSEVQNPNRVFGERRILSNMADWNPAEMIGAVSSPLAASLYDYLITRNEWAVSRARLGYKDMAGYQLMTLLASRPFVDLRLAFNSYLPASLPVAIAEKLVNAWLQHVSAQPKLHDKVEFEVAYTCWYFGFDDKFEQLKSAGLNADELLIVEDHYLQHTKQILKSFPELAQSLESKIEALEQWRIETQGDYRGLAALQRAFALLEKCRHFGTYSFAIYARWAFIATTLLRSLVNTGRLSSDRASQLERSVKTVAGEFIDAQGELCEGSISETVFMAKFGHLRPGAYDISAFRYDERPELFTSVVTKTSSPKTDAGINFVFSEMEKEILTPSLKEKLDLTLREFESFYRFAVKQREYGKFMFTKALSDALSNIKIWALDNNTGVESAQYLTVNQLADIALNAAHYNEGSLDAVVSNAKLQAKLDKAIILPDFISESADIDVVNQSLASPNFVSEQVVTAPLVECGSSRETPDLDGKIVMIVSADPGFDWIFSRDIKGLITQYGGAASHMTIRAAEFGLPAAIGCGKAHYEKLRHFNSVTLDCAAKKLVGH
ncbi:MAG: PEP/pyruvate-binding domain-containing protein [Aestuariibacter sp.]